MDCRQLLVGFSKRVALLLPCYRHARSGLGLDAQKEAVQQDPVAGGSSSRSSVEIESGKRAKRPQTCNPRAAHRASWL